MTVTAFANHAIIAQGPLAQVALALVGRTDVFLVLDDHTGRPIDLDLRGDADAIAGRYAQPQSPTDKPGRGRPKLGVVPREVTLLPRHWDWLNQQPGGASAALRRLVDLARRENAGQDARRQTQDLTYRIMSSLAGDLANYEEALRALFADDLAKFEALIAEWPADLQAYILARAKAVQTVEDETSPA